MGRFTISTSSLVRPLHYIVQLNILGEWVGNLSMVFTYILWLFFSQIKYSMRSLCEELSLILLQWNN